MSSFAKAAKAQRKSHKERSQPQNRARFGLLEKGKDWKLRRDDFKDKQKHIKGLATRARDRNQDEFYHGMINAKTKVCDSDALQLPFEHNHRGVGRYSKSDDGRASALYSRPAQSL
eukprot:m.33086 g.33086  ORF g.33086 m.33086 type:complete len:116 (-) comp12192_c0_seq16:623-970(-)